MRLSSANSDLRVPPWPVHPVFRLLGASSAGPFSILPDRRLSGAILTMSGIALNPAAGHAFRLTNDRYPPPFT